jgi:hypothetical protein
MKCIKLIKTSKGHEIGQILRTDDNEAEFRVKGGNWAFAPKSEWRATKRGKKEEVEISHDMGGSIEVRKEKKKNKK